MRIENLDKDHLIIFIEVCSKETMVGYRIYAVWEDRTERKE